MERSEIDDYLLNMPDDVLAHLKFSMPWQYSTEAVETDPDGFPSVLAYKEDTTQVRQVLQEECFRKFHRNPYMNTNIRGLTGRMVGYGFETSCEVWEVQEAISEIELDWRNRLYNFWPKWMARHFIEGELFLILTVHADGFVEVDFCDPAAITGKGTGDSGIIFHSTKTSLPLLYIIDAEDNRKEHIPSIFIARDPELLKNARKSSDFDENLLKSSRSSKKQFRKLGGFNRFMVCWEKGFMTRRAISHLRTTLEWLNHYENLKKYEIDHKKAAGSYLWVFGFEDPKAFKMWLSLTDEEKRTTALGAKLTPGGRLILPPGMTVTAESPTLPAIKDQDLDIKELVAAGFNEPSDIMTGTSGGTYASVKASRGPMSDRTSDEVAYFERFLRYDFWGSIFFLRSAVGRMRSTFKKNVAVGFNKSREPIMQNVSFPPERLIEINFPTTEVVDYEARARAFLGVKHGPIAEQLGISNAEIAGKLGFKNYGTLRLKKATEDKNYPDLEYDVGVDSTPAGASESKQERTTGEPGKTKAKPSETKKE